MQHSNIVNEQVRRENEVNNSEKMKKINMQREVNDY
jgi:hypothetical protein